MAYYNGNQIIGFKAISGYEDGRQDEWNDFWDAFQNNGARTNYGGAFNGCGWTEITFKPKYNMQPIYAHDMFKESNITSNMSSEAKEIFKSIDFSQCKRMDSCFNTSKFEEIGVIDGSSLIRDMSYTFWDCVNLKRIEKIILHPTYNDLASAFGYSQNIESVTFEGVITKNANFWAQKNLNDASVQNIIDCLMDLTGSTSQTLTFHNTVGGKLTDTQKATITAKNWTLVY